MKNDYEDDNTIDMLLDIEHFYGEHEGTVGNKIVCILVAGVPLVIYVYFALFYYIPVAVFVPIWLLYAIRVTLYIVGDEPTRLKYFKKMIHDVFSSLYELLRITRIHEDGLVEYLGGTVVYFVVAYNGNDTDHMVHSAVVKKFIESCVDDRDFDIYIQNVSDTQGLASRYKDVKIFADTEAAKDFVDIIDYNSKVINESSTMQKIVFAFKGHRGDWKEMRQSIDGAIHSKVAKCFKTVYRVTDPDEVEEIMSRDMDGVLSLKDVMRNKYCTGEYYGSRVLCYDDNKKQLPKSMQKRKPKQMIKGSNYAADDFHVMYKGE